MTPEQKILFSTLNFCQTESQGLIAWIENRHTTSRLFIGSNQKYNNLSHESNHFLLNENYINENNFSFDPLSNNKNCIILNVTPDTSIATNSGSSRNTSDSINYIVYLLWNGDKDCVKAITKYWFFNNFPLEQSLLFKTTDVPNGFFDSKITPYNLNKNWRHFCDVIEDEKFMSYFNVSKNITNFHNTLDKIFTEDPEKTFRLHSILRTLTLKISNSDLRLDKDNENQIGFMIYKLFEKHLPDSNLLASYGKTFPVIDFLISNKNKNNLFIIEDKSKYSLESFSINTNQLIQTFYDKEIPSNAYSLFTENIFNTMNKSSTLKDIGMKKVDLHKQTDEFNIYCTFDKSSSFNIKDIQSIYLELMDCFIKNNTKQLDYDDVINKHIEHFYLAKALFVDNSNTTIKIKNKI